MSQGVKRLELHLKSTALAAALRRGGSGARAEAENESEGQAVTRATEDGGLHPAAAGGSCEERSSSGEILKEEPIMNFCRSE